MTPLEKLVEAYRYGQFTDDMIDQFGISKFLRKVLRDGLEELDKCMPVEAVEIMEDFS